MFTFDFHNVFRGEKEGRDVDLHSQGLITDEELVLLLDSNRPKNPESSHNSHERFDLDELDEAEYKDS